MIYFIIINILLFILAMIFPIISFIVPVYNIRKQKKINTRNYIFARMMFIVFLIILLGLNSGLYYIFIFIIPEYFYLKFNSNKALTTFEKISGVSFMMVILLYYYHINNLEAFDEIFSSVRNIYSEGLGFTNELMDNTIFYIKQRMYFISYIFFYSINFMIYYVFNRKKFKRWFLNYYFLIPYIFAQILVIYGIENIVALNSLLIIKFIYSIFGAKEIYFLLERKIKNRFMRYFIAVSCFIYINQIVFVLGGIRSFKISYKRGGDKK